MRLPATVLLSSLLLLGCAPLPEPPPTADPMTGCFATGPRKAADFRIERHGGHYQLSLHREGGWEAEATPLRSASPADIVRYFPEDGASIAAALLGHDGAFGLFRLNEDATVKNRDRRSDYMALLVIGAGPVYRRRCE